MSRQPRLPPRCPISRAHSLDSPSSATFKDEISLSRHQKSVSTSFGLEEQPAWLDDLLGDWDSGLKLKTRSGEVSDSGIVLDDVNRRKDDKDACTRDVLHTALESACVYGPNSPRSKDKVSTEESAIVSALSEYASHGTLVSGFTQFDSLQDAAGEADMEGKPVKRHSAQRSRVRKLQYIAELERTVENFQNIVSDLAVRVDSMGKQHVYLSVENKQLKQQLARMQQEKFVKERQYNCMRNEVERLNRGVAFSCNGSKGRPLFRSNSSGDADKLLVEPTWNMIDMGKLHIN
nr:basic leucine zipper 6 [Tanacetum cinerariifolium]